MNTDDRVDFPEIIRKYHRAFPGVVDARCLSSWTRSRVKRVFDIAVVLASLPALIPLALVVAVFVRLTSPGPVLFLQERAGRNGIRFTILKFRTMSASPRRSGSMTTIDDPEITEAGRFLRHWKLDEIPQFLNVLRGEMSLVGPRPKVPEQQAEPLLCRPGITGAATIVFAHEEALLAGIPEHQLEEFFRGVVLPLKSRLDSAYMAKATFISDLNLLASTALRRFPRLVIEGLLFLENPRIEEHVIPFQPELELRD